MIPWLAIVHMRVKGWMPLRLWIPLFLLWLLLLPFVLVLAPIVFVLCLIVRIPPLRTLVFVWQVLAALRGTHIEVRDHESNFKIVIC